MNVPARDIVPIIGIESADLLLEKLEDFWCKVEAVLNFVNVAHDGGELHFANEFDEFISSLCFGGEDFDEETVERLVFNATGRADLNCEFCYGWPEGRKKIKFDFKRTTAHMTAYGLMCSFDGIATRLMREAMAAEFHLPQGWTYHDVYGRLGMECESELERLRFAEECVRRNRGHLSKKAKQCVWSVNNARSLLRQLHGEFYLIDGFLRRQTPHAVKSLLRTRREAAEDQRRLAEMKSVGGGNESETDQVEDTQYNETSFKLHTTITEEQLREMEKSVDEESNRNLLFYSYSPPSPPPYLGLVLNEERLVVSRAGMEEVPLSVSQLKLLKLFIRAEDRGVSKNQLDALGREPGGAQRKAITGLRKELERLGVNITSGSGGKPRVLVSVSKNGREIVTKK